MPEVSTFYGIRVTINFNDHLPPHFHAQYGDEEVLINIHTLAVYRGSVPRRALRMLLTWAQAHQEELLSAWDRAQAGESIPKIEPLP